jgi:hypothetical protein
MRKRVPHASGKTRNVADRKPNGSKSLNRNGNGGRHKSDNGNSPNRRLKHLPNLLPRLLQQRLLHLPRSLLHHPTLFRLQR